MADGHNSEPSLTKVYKKRAVFITCVIFSFLFMLYAGSYGQKRPVYQASQQVTIVQATRIPQSAFSFSTGEEEQQSSRFSQWGYDEGDKVKENSDALLSFRVKTRATKKPRVDESSTADVLLSSTGGPAIDNNALHSQTYITSDVKSESDGGRGSESCIFPDIDPFDKEIMSLVKTYPPLNCSPGIPSVIEIIGEKIRIDKNKANVKTLNGSSLACRYRSHWMKEGGDFETVHSDWSDYFTDVITLRDDVEHFVVECFRDKQKTPVAKSYHSRIRVTEQVESKLKTSYANFQQSSNKKEMLNILLIGIDGLSRSQMIRTMPQTRKFLDSLGAIEMTKFSKVGMNTFPNVISLLTGIPVEEHVTWNVSKPMDEFPFVWKEFQSAGYLTQLILDRTKVTAFHCSKLGWTTSPVHFYNRPTVVDSEADSAMRTAGENCIGDQPEVTHLLDYQVQLARRAAKRKSINTSLPFFSYSFFVHLTHDDTNMASAGDQLYASHLERLKEEGVTNNSVVILFSDHGPRFGPLRRTRAGMLEGPTPFCYLLFPPWFLQKYSTVKESLDLNRNRLATVFDLHATLRHLLHFNGSKSPTLSQSASRSVSLLREIPENRTCQQAGVRMEWCACNRHILVNTSSLVVRVLAYDFVMRLSEETDAVRAKCHRLTFRKLKSAFRLMTSFGSGTHSPKLYKMMVETSPGGGIFEGLLEFDPHTNVSKIVGTVDRLNMFQTQAKCMGIARYKPFCYCKDLDDS